MSLAALEHQKNEHLKLIAQREVALRLSKNADFRELILDEYIIKEAARYAALGGDPILKKEEREDAVAMSQAPGHLKRWLSVVIQMGNKAEDDMEDLDEQISFARAEEAEVASEMEGTIEESEAKAGDLQ